MSKTTTRVFAVFDAKMEFYMQPFFLPTRGAALRSFTDAANNPDTQISRHPADYALYEIGEFDDDNGRLIPHETNVSLGTALEFKRVDNQLELAGLRKFDPKKIVEAVEKNAEKHNEA